MTLWFIRGLRRGVVTTRYPASPDASVANLPTPPTFRSRSLTRQTADRLAWICPSGALRRDGSVLVYDVGRCTACGRCAAEAPVAVIRSGEFELATTDRSALVKRIPVREEAL
jgi:formate hydrogenlyase subunit 6/NADH:ubiquinone oxidoreductase subunit I